MTYFRKSGGRSPPRNKNTTPEERARLKCSNDNLILADPPAIKTLHLENTRGQKKTIKGAKRNHKGEKKITGGQKRTNKGAKKTDLYMYIYFFFLRNTFEVFVELDPEDFPKDSFPAVQSRGLKRTAGQVQAASDKKADKRKAL